MTEQKPREVMLHPEFGKIPARKILECVFALSPDGPILHCHIEEFDVDGAGDTISYRVNGGSPKPERSRCQIIPPLIPQFPTLD